jgi:AcrR family transcriptional regulator
MSARGRGRPRSETARAAIIAAASRLVGEHGYGGVSMEAIAREAGVSKQTLYRWWPTKAAIVLEGLNDAAAAIAPASSTGRFEADLRRFLRRTVAGAGGRNAKLLAALMAAAQLDDGFGEAFRAEFLARRREVLRELLVLGRRRGELDETADAEALTELVFASLWYRVLVRNAPLDGDFSERLADTIMALAGSARGRHDHGASR